MSDPKASSLRPTAPSLTKRYSKSSRVEPLHANIPAALFTHSIEPEPQYLPLGWTSCIHPEGQLYFHRDAPLKVVTEEHLYRSVTLERVLHWTNEAASAIERLGIPASDNIELYLELNDADESSCFYYFVDHATHSTFWLEPIPTDLLEIPPVVSTSHLKLALEELYWNHVEYFPTHVVSPTARVVDDLISLFTHAQADCMTSEYSTFPYTSAQSARFLKLLRPYQGKQPDAYVLCLVARLWGVVASHRFSTHYGQEHCRLSRDQTILPIRAVRQHWLPSTLSRLLFGLPANCVDKFESLWIDDMVYVEQWRDFMTSCQEDRKLVVSWALGARIINLLTLAFSMGSRSLAFASVFFSYGSIVSGLALFIRQQPLAKATASEAAVYLQNTNHKKYGFQFVSILYSLPKAFLIWSLALYIPQAPIMAFHALGLLTTTALSMVLSGVFFALLLVLYSIRVLRSSRKQSDEECSMVEVP
jgi:hypothetical protein